MDSSTAADAAKEIVCDASRRPQLFDLLMGATADVLSGTSGEAMPVEVSSLEAEAYGSRVEAIEALTAPLAAMVLTTAFYAEGHSHDRLLLETMERLANREASAGGNTALIALQRLPTLLVLLALGVGAIAGRRIRPFAQALADIRARAHGREQPLVSYLFSDIFGGLGVSALGLERHQTPVSDHLLDVLRPSAAGISLSDARLEDVFDDLEYVIGLAYLDTQANLRWAPLGRFVWRQRDAAPRHRVVERFGRELRSAGLFGDSQERLEEVRAAYEDQIVRSPHAW